MLRGKSKKLAKNYRGKEGHVPRGDAPPAPLSFTSLRCKGGSREH